MASTAFDRVLTVARGEWRRVTTKVVEVIRDQGVHRCSPGVLRLVSGTADEAAIAEVIPQTLLLAHAHRVDEPAVLSNAQRTYAAGADDPIPDLCEFHDVAPAVA